MYFKHKILMVFVFIAVFLITFFLKLDFNIIISECIAIVSFAMAIYSISISCLIGSSLLKDLESIQDKYLKDKTQLGVIKSYFKHATVISVTTLIFSCINKLEIIDTLDNLFFKTKILNRLNFSQIFSSICFAFFILNFIFIILIFTFIINRQVDK